MTSTSTQANPPPAFSISSSGPESPPSVLTPKLSSDFIYPKKDSNWRTGVINAKHIATMTNKANSKLLFFCHNQKGCLFLFDSLLVEYRAPVWDPYQKYNSDKVERVQRQAARFIKSRYTRYYSVSDMLDELGWQPLSQRRQEAQLILFYKIINGLAQVPFEGILVEAYKGTRKHNMKFRQIGQRLSGESILHL